MKPILFPILFMVFFPVSKGLAEPSKVLLSQNTAQQSPVTREYLQMITPPVFRVKTTEQKETEQETKKKPVMNRATNKAIKTAIRHLVKRGCCCAPFFPFHCSGSPIFLLPPSPLICIRPPIHETNIPPIPFSLLEDASTHFIL